MDNTGQSQWRQHNGVQSSQVESRGIQLSRVRSHDCPVRQAQGVAARVTSAVLRKDKNTDTCRLKTHGDGWTYTRPNAEGTRGRPSEVDGKPDLVPKKEVVWVDKWLAEPDPPSKNGIWTGGPRPDLMRYYQGAC
jgi:hypothetical protein